MFAQNTRLTLCLFYAVISYTAHAIIITVDSLDYLHQQLATLNEKSLVIFDRDDTLLQGIDCLDQITRTLFVQQWKEMYEPQKTDVVYKAELAKKIANAKPTLVDENAPALIKELQNRGVKVIGLTRGCYGKNIVDINVEDLTIAAFASAGICLHQAFEEYSGSVLTSVTNNGYQPLFKSGILFSNTCDKGKTLEAFLALVAWRPDRIIFVDDKKHYVQEVERIAEELNIIFTGLHYRGAQKLPKPDLTEQCYKMCYLLIRDLE